MAAPVRWIPNALTGLRILLLPAVLLLIAAVDEQAGRWAGGRMAVMGLFFLLALTDWLDGYLARRLEATTRWGSMADAVADRLALLLPLSYLALSGHPAFPAVPLWIPLWLMALDATAGAFWLVARSKAGVGAPVSHIMVGRAGVWILYALVLWIMAELPAAGVGALGIIGLTLATASVLLHIRRWLGATRAPRQRRREPADPDHASRSKTPV